MNFNPADLWNDLRRRRVFQVAAIYAAVAWVVVQVAGEFAPALFLPGWVMTALVVSVIIGFPIAVILAWLFDVGPDGVVRTKPGSAAGILTILASIGLLVGGTAAFVAIIVPKPAEQEQFADTADIDPNSVAVLPFMNISGNPDNEYLSDGITETLLHAISQLRGLKVPARTSSFFFKGQDIDIREIAAQLGVAYVLEGSVQRAGDRLRIVAQLIEADTGFHRWSKTYDREMNDIFAVQDDIANSIARAMHVTLSDMPGRGGGEIESVSTDDVAAYQTYLEGIQQKNERSYKSLLLADISFKNALARDPDFFEARLELALNYIDQANTGAIAPAEANQQIIPLVDRLLEAKPDSALALMLAVKVDYLRSISLGDGSFDFDKHFAELSAAVERMPNELRLYSAISELLRTANRIEESLKWVDRGIAIDPLNSQLYFFRGATLRQSDDLDGAAAAYARAMELNPDDPNIPANAAAIAWKRKQFAQSFAMFRKAIDLDPLDAGLQGYLSAILYDLGLVDEADKYLQRAIAISGNPTNSAGNLRRMLLRQNYVQARDRSKAMLRDDSDVSGNAYWWAAIVFMSTMTEFGETDEALAFLEELTPGVTSPDFRPEHFKQQVLQYVAVLGLLQSQPRAEILVLLDAVVPRWDETFPGWLQSRSQGTPIEMTRGDTALAIELALKDLEERADPLLYRHLFFWKAVGQEPPVAARLDELEAEARRAGEEIWAYIVANDLQL